MLGTYLSSFNPTQIYMHQISVETNILSLNINIKYYKNEFLENSCKFTIMGLLINMFSVLAPR